MVILVSNRVSVWQLPGTNNGVAAADPKWNTTSLSVSLGGAPRTIDQVYGGGMLGVIGRV